MTPKLNEQGCGLRLFIMSIVFSATTAAAQTVCPPNPDWSYRGPRGPRHWVEQWPTCGGKAQSPISIPSNLRPRRGPAVEFHYQPFDLVVENTSHGIEVPAAGGGFILVDGHRYDLEQFHFHTPSEHRLGGRALALEIHLVHRDTKGQQAAVAIMAVERRANAALQPVVTALPIPSCEHRDQHVRFDASTLLPAKREYVTYGGSLTTPGCDEGLAWVVLSQSISVSTRQRAKLGPFGPNARPVQRLNGRAIVRVRQER